MYFIKIITYFVYLFILIYKLAVINGLENNAEILLHNDTHLKLSWNDAKCIESKNNFSISINVTEMAVKTTRTYRTINVSCKNETTNYYEMYADYDEGVKYEIVIKLNETLIKKENITTPININANLTCLDGKFTAVLNDSKIIKGERKIKLCVSNDESDIFNAETLSVFNLEPIPLCNQSKRTANCNLSYNLLGIVEFNNGFPLNIQIIETSQAESSSSNISYISVLIIIIVSIILLILLITVILIYTCKRNRQKTERDMIPLNRLQSRFVDELSLVQLENLLKEPDIRNDIDNEFENTRNGSNMKLAKHNANNRYSNARPYEHNRVKLGTAASYINASYIKDFKGFNKYIATQGPMTATINDFWEMIWQENVEVIVMLTGLMESNKEKCIQYWHNITRTYNNLSVNYLKTTNYVGYLVREFKLTKLNETRSIQQMHFISWPDHDVPYSPHIMVSFMRHFRSLEIKSPIVVHCSAGLGRTGSFILCDYILDQAETTSCVNFALGLKHLRNCRQGMIQQIQQYLLAYCTVLEYISTQPRNIPIDQYSTIKSTYAQTMLTDLNFIEESKYWLNLLYYKTTHPFYEDIKSRNRKSTVVSGFRGFVYLETATDQQYINAVKLDHFYKDKMLICTQNPLPNTIDDFWKLISDENIQLIIILQAIGSNRSPIFWPNNIAMKSGDDIEITRKSFKSYESYDVMELELTEFGECRNLDVMYFKNWNGDGYPDTVEFMQFFLYSINNKFSNITIVCHDGSSACGIYLTLLKIMEYIQTEKVFDICSPVRTLRSYRDDFMIDPEQFIFVYKAIGRYLEMEVRQNLNLPDIIEDD